MRQAAPTIKSHFNPRVASLEQLATLLKLPQSKLEWLVKHAPSLYTSFQKKKPNGKYRTICPPKSLSE